MLQIKLHTHWLDVDKNTTIQWEIENPLFTQGELLGDVSGNFSVPAFINLPSCVTMLIGVFASCPSLATIILPLCTNLGGTVGDDNVYMRGRLYPLQTKTKQWQQIK